MNTPHNTNLTCVLCHYMSLKFSQSSALLTSSPLNTSVVSSCTQALQVYAKYFSILFSTFTFNTHLTPPHLLHLHTCHISILLVSMPSQTTSTLAFRVAGRYEEHSKKTSTLESFSSPTLTPTKLNIKTFCGVCVKIFC